MDVHQKNKSAIQRVIHHATLSADIVISTAKIMDPIVMLPRQVKPIEVRRRQVKANASMQWATVKRFVVLFLTIYSNEPSSPVSNIASVSRSRAMYSLRAPLIPITELRHDLITKQLTFDKVQRTRLRRLQPHVFETQAPLTETSEDSLAHRQALSPASSLQPRTSAPLKKPYRVTLWLSSFDPLYC